MNYTKLEIANFNNKDKRIAWLSIFSTLSAGNKENTEEEAFRLTDKLFEAYPIVEEDVKIEPL